MLRAMQVSKIGPLRVRRVDVAGKTEEDRRPLTVVLMHGYGAPGDDLVGLADMIDAPPGTTFLFPEAPHPLSDFVALPMMGDARAWWAVDLERFERAMMRGTVAELVKTVPEGLASARDEVCSMLDALDLGDRLVLGGFSQGSMLAIDVALRTTRPLAGVVALSSTLIAADEWIPKMPARKALPLFQSHGTADPILPFVIAEQLRHAFEDAGLRVDFRAFEGGHGVPPQVLRDLGAWLRAL